MGNLQKNVWRFNQNGQNMGLPLWAWFKKTIHWVETQTPVKKKFPGVAVIKECYVYSLP